MTKCPHCSQEIPGTVCPLCGETTPASGRYCMQCGSSLLASVSASVDEDDGEVDFENRVLCPDGTCTGIVVGGKCTVCGRSPIEAESGS
jgi:hypothetical protein